jgi:hypothetical protein
MCVKGATKLHQFATRRPVGDNRADGRYFAMPLAERRRYAHFPGFSAVLFFAGLVVLHRIESMH